MKRSSLTVIIVVAAIAIIVLWLIKGYNNMVALEESVDTAWSNVEADYQRRADLLPNLVNIVKGYAAHESSTFENIVNARSKATQITVDPKDMTPEQMEEFQKAQGEVGAAFGRLMAITENYPELKANENFRALQEQWEGTENRIKVARKSYNETAQTYNTTIRRFPNNLISNFFNTTIYFINRIFSYTNNSLTINNFKMIT